ncbi:hypothetical protein HN803_01820 [candidate division WWE3 bacterium]|nr:hypothetical protein [candidate division WWE3 bacterium]MBT7349509.1 hypothetical protein [candidate division WWE3 bacterium]
MKKRKLLIVIVSLLLLGGVSYAAFGDRVEVLGTSVTVGSADIKLLDDLAGGVSSGNLVDSKQGPSFEKISPGWVADYPLKVFNNGTSVLKLSSVANYETAEDPEELRQIIFVEPFVWLDANGDGVSEEGELGQSFGKKTIVKWKTEGYILGDIASGGLTSYVLRFSAETIPDSKQGAAGVFSFEIDASEI